MDKAIAGFSLVRASTAELLTICQDNKSEIKTEPRSLAARTVFLRTPSALGMGYELDLALAVADAPIAIRLIIVAVASHLVPIFSQYRSQNSTS
jgi:hypothetical protein